MYASSWDVNVLVIILLICLICFCSHSTSPLQDIMNTPKFQLRKVQRQMIKERNYRDGLERELASKIALVAQRGTTQVLLFGLKKKLSVRLIFGGKG